MEGKISFPLQWDKLAAAVVYLAERSRHDDAFGETKLVKLLYYADCAAFQRTGKPITGATYIHMEHGPYPENWQPIRRRLESEGAIRVIAENVAGGYQRHRAIAGASARAEALSDEECTFLNEQLRRFSDFNAAQIEEYSHDELGWHITTQGEVIPYETSGIRRPGPPDEETKARGRRIAKRIRDEGRRISRVIVGRDETL